MIPDDVFTHDDAAELIQLAMAGGIMTDTGTTQEMQDALDAVARAARTRRNT